MDSREPPSAPPHRHPPPGTMHPIPNSYSAVQNPRFPFSPAGNSPYGDGSISSGGGGGFSAEPARKKRGRPRKYSPDRNIALGLNPNPSPSPGSGAGAIVPVSADLGSGGSASDPVKKGRGRPPGSGKRQLDALGGAAGIGFTPHVILVKAGEDICSKVKAFSQQGPRTICLLSANGAVSNASICTSTFSGGSVTYEGRYEIISLEGSFTLSDSNGGDGRMGGMTVTLAGPDGRVLGGCVSGMLIAASPVQVIVGSFIEDGKKPKYVPSSSLSVPNILNFGPPVAAASPPSQGPSSESSSENGGSPYNGGSGPYTNANQQPLHSMSMYTHSGWGNSAMNMHHPH